MKEGHDPDKDLGRTLTVVRPHPISVLIGCIPGLVWGFVVLTSTGPSRLMLLLHPEIELPKGMRLFLWICLIGMVFLLGLGLRHIFDRVDLCQEGIRIRRKAYRFERMEAVRWKRSSQSGMTQFWDLTVMTFRYDGKEVRLKTRYLQDLSYQYHRIYSTDPTEKNQ